MGAREEDNIRALVELLIAEGILVSPDTLTEYGHLPPEAAFQIIKAKEAGISSPSGLRGGSSAFSSSTIEEGRFADGNQNDAMQNPLSIKTDSLSSRTIPLSGMQVGSVVLPSDEQAGMVSECMASSVDNAASEDVLCVSLFKETSSKLEIQDFIGSLNNRYKSMENMLMSRRELSGTLSIARAVAKKEKGEVCLIGMVREKELTSKNKHLKFTIEDPSGSISVLVNKNNKELFDTANDTVLDEVIGVKGSTGDKIVFANSFHRPDIPMYKELKRQKEEAYAIVLSDMHVGSNNFLGEELEKAISWIKGDIGNDKQKEIASKIKYVFILGDLVDGVGVYPDQNKELIIKDIYDQYKACAEYLKEIPKKMKMIIIPGNHDAVRIEEPQPPLYDDIAAPIFKLPNSIMLSNPSTVNLMSGKDFPGYDFLLYHGYSFPFYADSVESLRMSGGVDRADLIMKFLLQRRHLAPTHASTVYNPNAKKDYLIIDKIPDFFLSGHLHKTIVSTYNGITMVSGSCWQSKTSFMEKMGIHPEPARIPLINLATREVKIMRFAK